MLKLKSSGEHLSGLGVEFESIRNECPVVASETNIGGPGPQGETDETVNLKLPKAKPTVNLKSSEMIWN